ncbi:nucleotide exchange factor GrpE [Agreia sp. COWG]|uniref:nucleotide exchange factor GrpE n=1 Tax=Agreia sp. COWG TaxID=2773266 RepID=UPI00192791BA|nr:nucleotide exchange factor GrpE [Agreia sp. COWG]CAD6007184.1 Protein GrpE [Agreia sp. COWG]
MTETNATPEPAEGSEPESVETPAAGSGNADASGDDSATEAGTPIEGEFIEAEGPDVETSLSDADLSFLDDAKAPSSSTASDEVLATERLADLQRVTAEYANYRKRTEANREIERERTVGDVVKVLLPVLDDLDRAEKHGDLVEGPFASIAQKLRAGTERLGLAPFGAIGEAFDPKLHEAIFQQPSAEVEVETVADVVETGYYLGSTLLRAAKVVVSTPVSA